VFLFSTFQFFVFLCSGFGLVVVVAVVIIRLCVVLSMADVFLVLCHLVFFFADFPLADSSCRSSLRH
jgi:hypothetical protein